MRRSPGASLLVALFLAGCTALAGLDGDYVLGELSSGGQGTATGATGGTSGPGGSGGEGGGTGASGASGGMGGSGAGGGGGAGPCEGLPGPTMVDLGTFCIDSTEVTNAQYIEFLNAAYPLQSSTGDPSYCSFNSSYYPDVWPAPVGHDDHAVLNIDWCDAYAYCEWAGKRLCGGLDDGGPSDFDALADVAGSEWMYACTAGGTQAYGFGNVGDGTVCNILETGHLITVEAGSMPDCHGLADPYSAIFDLSGSAHEWTNECTGWSDGSDVCAFRGGSFEHPLAQALCSDDGSLIRAGTWSDGSVRCCADKR